MEPPKMARYKLVSELTERREHPRIPLRLPTEYLLPEAVKGRLCHTLNICESGVLLCVPEKIKVGQRLKVEIYYCFEYELSIFEAIGEVVWTERVEDCENEYRCALEFLDLGLEDMDKLRRFLRKIFY